MKQRRRRAKTDLQRLLDKVEFAADGCWNFTGYITPAGYGQFYYQERRNNFAHRAAYIEFRAPIPDGLHLDHLCRNTRCCNPWHLEPVTCRENILRGVSPMAQNARKTHCPKGHAYAGGNLYIRPDGKGRDCVTCRWAVGARRNARRRAESAARRGATCAASQAA